MKYYKAVIAWGRVLRIGYALKIGDTISEVPEVVDIKLHTQSIEIVFQSKSLRNAQRDIDAYRDRLNRMYGDLTLFKSTVPIGVHPPS